MKSKFIEYPLIEFLKKYPVFKNQGFPFDMPFSMAKNCLIRLRFLNDGRLKIQIISSTGYYNLD